MKRGRINPWLTRYAVFTAFCALALIGLGGVVTSKGAGLAVPDWPTTYGYNMFLFPVSNWVGGIFYEHTHRLFASFVGLLTTVLAVWLWLKESRRWLRWLGMVAFILVVGQGVLGGLRVTLLKDELGIFHAVLAQLFLVLVSLIALWTSGWWQALNRQPHRRISAKWGYAFGAAAFLILVQLSLGAAMRHEHAGLAVPDFPLAYGQVWPATDAGSIEIYNQHRLDYRHFGPVTPYQIHLHMAHRIGGVVIAVLTCLLFGRFLLQVGRPHVLFWPICAWAGLILLQVLLGVATIWSGKAADIATAHVVAGAASLVGAVLLGQLSERLSLPQTEGRVSLEADPGMKGIEKSGASA